MMLSVSRLYSLNDMINEYAAGGAMKIGRGNRSVRKKPAQTHFVHQYRTRAAAPGSQKIVT
jgi:hypothetical protein